MKPNNQTDAEVAWAAGLFEGEGTTYQQSRNRRVWASINMNDAEILHRFRAVIGMGKVYGPYSRLLPRHHPYYRWNLEGRHRVASLYELLGPWLGSRRRAQFETALIPRLPKPRANAAPIGPPCGFYSQIEPSTKGFDQHRRRGEIACQICRECLRLYQRDHKRVCRARQRAKATP